MQAAINKQTSPYLVEKIADETYRIDESGIANCYLIIGEEKALLIDSGLGVGNILAVTKTLTDKPVTLVLTHRHCDHAGGAGFFKECYVEENDLKLTYAFLSGKFARKLLLKARTDLPHLTLAREPFRPKYRSFKDGALFELGNRQLKAVLVPGHTRGSVAYLDDKYHLMFTGDDVNPWLWLQLPGCTPLSEWLIGAKKLLALSSSYKAYCGHGSGLLTSKDIGGIVVVGEKLLSLGKKTFHKTLVTYPSPSKEDPYKITISRRHIR